MKNSSELSSTNRGKSNTTQPANLDLIMGKWQAALGTGTAMGKTCNNSDTLNLFIFLLHLCFYLRVDTMEFVAPYFFLPLWLPAGNWNGFIFIIWINNSVLSVLSWAWDEV